MDCLAQRVGRNDPCPCGSGKKYKKCHGAANRATSTLEEHQLDRKTLSPPLLRVSKLQPMHWMDDRLPEVLWAALLATHFPREYTLSIFREVARYVSQLGDREKIDDITFTGLAKIPPDKLADFLPVIATDKPHKEALSPLLLLEELPCREQWTAALAGIAAPDGWDRLALAVARTMYHQSEEATDCRWLKVIVKAASGKLYLPSSDFGPELAKELENYPHYGDMAKVRPSIRAMEGALYDPQQPQASWPAKFWAQCMRDTACFPLKAQRRELNLSPGTDVCQIATVWNELLAHSRKTTVTTAVDARHDAVFGLAFFSLSILQELLRVGNSQSIMGRLALRSLVEAYITLAYLLKADQPDLWQSYRVFGSGQMKLAFLELEEVDKPPSSVDLETFQHLANEDTWQEFLPINLGHWEGSDLRKMSIDAGAKEEYDHYYAWTSTYSHSHWGAVRETVFDTCANPLHRLHRIPRAQPHALPDVVPDASEMVDKILCLVSKAYPKFEGRTAKALTARQPAG